MVLMNGKLSPQTVNETSLAMFGMTQADLLQKVINQGQGKQRPMFQNNNEYMKYSTSKGKRSRMNLPNEENAYPSSPQKPLEISLNNAISPQLVVTEVTPMSRPANRNQTLHMSPSAQSIRYPPKKSNETSLMAQS